MPDESQPRGVSWLVGPFALAAFVIGQLIVELASYGVLRAAGVVVDPGRPPRLLTPLRVVLGSLLGGVLALIALRVTTQKDDPAPILRTAFGPLQPIWLPCALLIAPCAAILAGDLDSLLLHVVPTSEQELVLYQQTFFPDDALARVITMIGTIVVAPLVEELIFRGPLLRGLARRYGALGGALLTSILFAVAHFNLRTAPLLFLLGFGNALLAARTGSLALPIVMHSIYNASFYLLLPAGAVLPPRALWRAPWLPWIVFAGAAAGLAAGVALLRPRLQRSNSPAMP